MVNIPHFPSFIRLGLNHKALLKEAAKQFPPYSDFNFVSLFTWDTDKTMGVSNLFGNLVVRFSDYDKDEVFLSLLGINHLSESLEALFAYTKERGIKPQLRLIPKTVIEAMTLNLHDEYKIVEDRDNHDYIMSTHQIQQGDIARNKRRSYDHFRQTHDDHLRCGPLDLHSSEDIKQIKEVLGSWEQARNESERNKKEILAIDRCLRHAKDLAIEAYGAYADNQLIAFIIFERTLGPTAILHYGKSRHGEPGAFDYVKIKLAEYLSDLGIDFMNFEQDLGLEGLRLDKDAYRPIGFLKKYTITKKDQELN